MSQTLRDYDGSLKKSSFAARCRKQAPKFLYINSADKSTTGSHPKKLQCLFFSDTHKLG